MGSATSSIDDLPEQYARIQRQQQSRRISDRLATFYNNAILDGVNLTANWYESEGYAQYQRQARNIIPQVTTEAVPAPITFVAGSLARDASAGTVSFKVDVMEPAVVFAWIGAFSPAAIHFSVHSAEQQSTPYTIQPGREITLAFHAPPPQMTATGAFVPLLVRIAPASGSGCALIVGIDTSSTQPRVVRLAAELGGRQFNLRAVYDTETGDLRQCSICGENAASVICMPCNHRCMCRNCALMLNQEAQGRSVQCPYCRQSCEKMEEVVTQFTPQPGTGAVGQQPEPHYPPTDPNLAPRPQLLPGPYMEPGHMPFFGRNNGPQQRVLPLEPLPQSPAHAPAATPAAAAPAPAPAPEPVVRAHIPPRPASPTVLNDDEVEFAADVAEPTDALYPASDAWTGASAPDLTATSRRFVRSAAERQGYQELH